MFFGRNIDSYLNDLILTTMNEVYKYMDNDN